VAKPGLFVTASRSAVDEDRGQASSYSDDAVQRLEGK
jgi:hypothetical protein